MFGLPDVPIEYRCNCLNIFDPYVQFQNEHDRTSQMIRDKFTKCTEKIYT